jgi:hypothetical protein
MSNIEVTAKAKVQITVEVDASLWGLETPIEQVFEQASRSALGDVNKIAQKEGWRIIGEPKVIDILCSK